MNATHPIIHAAAENLAQTPWEPLTLSSGWQAVAGHQLRVCQVGQLIYINGAVIRRGGGYKSNIATVPKRYVPRMTQFVGGHVTSRGTSFELYINDRGVLSCDAYNTVGDGTGMILPLSCMYLIV